MEEKGPLNGREPNADEAFTTSLKIFSVRMHFRTQLSVYLNYLFIVSCNNAVSNTTCITKNFLPSIGSGTIQYHSQRTYREYCIVY